VSQDHWIHCWFNTIVAFPHLYTSHSSLYTRRIFAVWLGFSVAARWDSPAKNYWLMFTQRLLPHVGTICLILLGVSRLKNYIFRASNKEHGDIFTFMNLTWESTNTDSYSANGPTCGDTTATIYQIGNEPGGRTFVYGWIGRTVCQNRGWLLLPDKPQFVYSFADITDLHIYVCTWAITYDPCSPIVYLPTKLHRSVSQWSSCDTTQISTFFRSVVWLTSSNLIHSTINVEDQMPATRANTPLTGPIPGLVTANWTLGPSIPTQRHSNSQ